MLCCNTAPFGKLRVMSLPPLLSPIEIDRLLHAKMIKDDHLWATGDEQLVEGYLKAALAAVERTTQTKSKVEWDHYGSGYASFVDVWLYRATPDFDAKRPLGYGEQHTGLVILLSRLSPYFVFMEGEKHWHPHGASSYLPEFSMVDRLETPAVRSLAGDVEVVLQGHGLVRALRAQLEEPLTTDIQVPTILTDKGFNQFDALFYWED